MQSEYKYDLYKIWDSLLYYDPDVKHSHKATIKPCTELINQLLELDLIKPDLVVFGEDYELTPAGEQWSYVNRVNYHIF